MEEFIIQVFAPIAQWLGASNSCINPVLYAFFNAKLKSWFQGSTFWKKSHAVLPTVAIWYKLCVIIFYLLPLFIILLCYGSLWLKVWRRKLSGGHPQQWVGAQVKDQDYQDAVRRGDGLHGFLAATLCHFARIKVGDPYPENSMEEFITMLDVHDYQKTVWRNS
ncbi:hypothetical protein CEXT_517651 [Caerostris extrusa]|uniref:G-protein coupled receptors family 1 profile domain-containing protein n=1 Tax=Caerostris extrusa TaxID=172846 RepID=A0AAV4VM55_CAEEX|nr:hypothetical protein CEXT_517651 [Caerostris extrusa]